jgi:DMSO reductase family type II enzyme heme b subunit
MSKQSTRTLVALATVIVVASAVVPALVDARPAREIPAPTVDGNLSGTAANGWDEVAAAEVPLSAAPSGLPNAESVNTRSVDVQAARSDGTVYVRLQWQDDGADRNASDPTTFMDGAAIQIPVDTTAQPAIAMGSQTNLVNVWFWKADGSSEELFAGGQGSTTQFRNPTVQTWAQHAENGEDGTWTVVFSREAEPDGDNRTAITDERDLDIAFAVWDGANDERSGQKAVSEWYYLPFGPDESGTPFESLLWVLAGIAVVAVVVVTAQGIRRARSDEGGGT